jgi:hypothetical protein
VPDQIAGLLTKVAAGILPPADGRVTVLPQPSPRDAGVFGFTAHAVVFADTDPEWIAGQLPAGDLAAPLSPPFLAALAARLRRRVHNIDMLCTATPLPGPPPRRLTQATPDDHPRIARAHQYRREVRAWNAGGGFVILGRGVAGRWEAAIEVEPGLRDKGLGRELATVARHLVPDGAPLWAQISPGNAASVRAFLAAGYTPVGAEALFVAHTTP